MKRLSIPSVLAVVAISGIATVGAIAACGDDDQPQQCTVEGTCPPDGKVCLKPSDGTLCCPICPINGQCAEGCVLDFPPV